MKRRTLVLILVLSMSCFLFGCGSSGETDTESSGSSYEEENDGELSDSEIESKATSALYNQIGSKFDTADPGSCRYSINKTESNGDGSYTVYGTVTLYDKYGKTTGGWTDGSGTPFREFSVTINSSGSTSCHID